VNYKKVLAIIIFSSPLLFFYDIVFAVTAVSLSGDFPTVAGMVAAGDQTFFVYAYNVCIAGGAFIAVGALIVQGVKILTAGGNAGKVVEAKERFGSISLGLGVLLSSYAMLAAINPQILEIKLPSFENIGFTNSLNKINPDNPNVSYVEVPIGAQIESILNAVSTANSQAYNYSSLDVGDKSGEERCYLYNEYGNAIDKNGDGYITELDEYQGLDFSICINELLKAAEHKILYLNGDKYRCGTAGYTDADSPKAIGDIGTPAHGILGDSGKTILGTNYHDWDDPNTTICNWAKYPNVSTKCTKAIETSDCNIEGTEGIINKLKKYIRDGCTCSNCGTCCQPNCVCCGSTRGRNDCCQGSYNNIYNDKNPYMLFDPCTTRRSMDCMRKFINYIVYGNIVKDYAQRQVGCIPQEAAVSYPTSGVGSGTPPIVFDCEAFPEAGDPEVKGNAETTSLMAVRERLMSFRIYYEKRLADLEKTEKFLMSDKRLELYSRAEIQNLQQEAVEKYSFSQASLSFPYAYDTVTYRRKFNCSLYDNPVNLNKKNVYEDDADRIQDFNEDWGANGIGAMYTDAQKNNRKIRIRTGEAISNLHVDGSMKIVGNGYNDLTADEREASLCSRGDLATLQGDNIKFFDIDKKCIGGGSGKITARSLTMDKKRMVAWNDSLYTKGGISYLNSSDISNPNREYYTGEEMATNGDPLTFYVLEDPKVKVDPYYTGRDQMPYYFQKGFIDFTQYAENTAIDTEIIQQRGNILPSLIPIGQLSYHTKIYAKQMIRNLNRTIEQVDAAMNALDVLANDRIEGGCDCSHCSGEGGSSCASYSTDGYSYCNTIERYDYFDGGDFIPENKEILAENVIDDNSPRQYGGTIKMIVKNRSCVGECKKNSSQEAAKPFMQQTKPRYQTVLAGEIDFRWDGSTPIQLSGSPTSLTEVYVDDILKIVNTTNGKSKEWGSKESQGGSSRVFTGYPMIVDLLNTGNNHLEFWVTDEWDLQIGTKGIYLFWCNQYDYMCGGPNSGNPKSKIYVVPEGFELLECNAWDSDLKEERPCVDFKGDIVVTLVNEIHCGKPVVYLYPEKKIEANVKVVFDGEFTENIPKYDKDKGWDVVAYPTGKLINKDDGKEYNYLYWEGDTKIDFNLSEGFVIEGEKTKEFLEKKLKEIGLNKIEYDEFIEYWEPRMKDNKYNLIHFSGKEYTDAVEMNIVPKPDSVLRVFMAYQPLDEFKFVVPQKFEKFERKGFTVVEWGGGVVNKDTISFGK